MKHKNWEGFFFVCLFDEAWELTQMDSVGLLSISSVLLDQGGKGHRQDVFAFPRALASPGYLGQLYKETKTELYTEKHQMLHI